MNITQLITVLTLYPLSLYSMDIAQFSPNSTHSPLLLKPTVLYAKDLAKNDPRHPSMVIKAAITTNSTRAIRIEGMKIIISPSNVSIKKFMQIN